MYVSHQIESYSGCKKPVKNTIHEWRLCIVLCCTFFRTSQVLLPLLSLVEFIVLEALSGVLSRAEAGTTSAVKRSRTQNSSELSPVSRDLRNLRDLKSRPEYLVASLAGPAAVPAVLPATPGVLRSRCWSWLHATWRHRDPACCTMEVKHET